MAGTHAERRMQTPDGGTIVSRALIGVPMQDPVTDMPAVLVFVHNITQQKQMEMQLAQRQEALQR